jgi:hypothetical protein
MLSPPRIARFEALLARGRLDPFVLDALTRGELKEAAARVRPGYLWYEKARAALAEYRALAARGGWPAVPPGRAPWPSP